ncbi:MAG: quinolinate synthase NadA [Deltaproteobacteria bacterium]|nr:quinolinate synthase NadA [Deltaproteobacteria bacterium]
MTTAFPRLRIERDRLVPNGTFAQTQATYLQPDPATVAELDQLLTRGNVGVVAHFYMDPELQGVLSACSWPQIHISDSLVMADRAVAMAQAGVRAVLVAGVDFMSENVRAVLDAAGFTHLPVYRLARDRIGCSLAEAAESRAYAAFLAQAAAHRPALHVVYINTSLKQKAAAQATVPTITCTSSNVVQTILQAASQLPTASIWYGPDSYMGDNLLTILATLAKADPATVRAVHPAHTPATVAALLGRFHRFDQGHCIVHHLFGAQVVEQVRRDHQDALLTAHLEVPGEMFALAHAAQTQGRGMVGSTANLLDFILAKLRQAPDGTALQVVLGTEAGMITSIVRAVQAELRRLDRTSSVEVIFPVAAEAIATTGDASLPVVPGAAGGEGCSVAGGCATCPYLKMNHLDGLLAVAKAAGNGTGLAGFEPQMDAARIAGRSVVELGSVPILHMRAFQKTGALPPELVADVLNRGN